MNNKVIVETSARHIHLSRADLEVLFGAGYQLTKKKDLSQPGQFACEEKVTVVGPKGSVKMSVLGPERKETQVEVSFTEARTLGISVPVRESGDIAGSAVVRLEGPAGAVAERVCAIAAMRHIHFTPEDAADLGVNDKDVVSVKVGGVRGVVFDNTIVRVNSSYARAMHIDTDEANAAGISGPVDGEIIK